MSSRVAWRYLAFAAVVTIAYYGVPHSATSKLILYNGLGLTAVCAIVIGIWKNKPAYRLPWILFAAGQASFLIGDIAYYWLEEHSTVAPFPSIADAFYLGMYPLMIIGLILLIRRVAPGRDLTSILDASIVALSMLAVLWVLFVDNYAHDASLTPLARTISIAYPVMDIALFAVAVRVGAAIRLRHVSSALVIMSLGSLVVADTLYNILTAANQFHTGSYVDAFWLLFYVLFGAAALHPAMADHPKAERSDFGTVTFPRFTLLFLATLTVPAVNLLWGGEQDRVVTTVASAGLFTLVLIRLVGLMLAIQRGQERLRHEALHDSLTSLANRGLFADRIAHALEHPGRGTVAVLFIDLDDFKTVNDSLGHQAGDELLISVAARLEESVDPICTVARLGGDEFAVLAPGVFDGRGAELIAGRIMEALNEPLPIKDREIRVAASIGISLATDGDGDVEGLLRGADVAMYLAKAKGKGRFEFFQQAMYDEVIERLDLKADLVDAVEQHQFEIHYQPIVDFDQQRLMSIEALVRWNHPTRGLIQPDRFIPLAEESGLIVPIGRWVLREACRNARQWQLDHPENSRLSVSVNLSVRQLYDPGLLQDVTDALRISGLAPESLTIEVTESVLMEDSERCARALADLKALKVKISIDDFGTGYSSLNYLRSFPVDVIKIDRSFVSELATNETSQALVRTVIDLAEALGASTVAEGIENVGQFDALSAMNCRMGQGFFFSKPREVAAMQEMLVTSRAMQNWPTGLGRGKTTAQKSGGVQVHTIEGVGPIDRFADDLDELHRALGVPVMGRWPWLRLWAEHHRDWDPVGVLISGPQSFGLHAAALLARRQTLMGIEWCGMGVTAGGSLHLAARNQRTASYLADAIGELLESDPRPWTLQMEQLVHPDPVAAILAQRWGDRASMKMDLRIPRVRLDASPTHENYLGRNMRKQLRRARSRAAAEGKEISISFSAGRSISAEQLAEIERIHVHRDHEAKRRSDLDDLAERRFWTEVVLARRAAWEVEVASLRIDDELAAYVVSLLDGDVYRVFDGRMDTCFARFSPGRLVEAATLERALNDPRFSEVDWMSGVGADKLLVVNTFEERFRFMASSRAPSSTGGNDELEGLDALEDDAPLV